MIEKLQSHIKTHPNSLIIVLGPTASGKTALALDIAKQIDGEIISTDSRQIYRQMDISTDLIQPADQQGIPHHLIGIADPDETLTLAQYYDLAIAKIADIQARGKIPMLVGGTGLYISAIIDGYELRRIPPNPELRARLEQDAEKHGKEFVYAQLQKLDPTAAAKIAPQNLRFVIRAIERALSDSQESLPKVDAVDRPWQTFLLGIEWPRAELYERINHRVDLQIQRGLIAEVQTLLAKGYAGSLPSMSSLGVKEIIPYLNGEQTLEEAIATLKQNTRRYAKRQLTWFRRYDNIHWLKPSEL